MLKGIRELPLEERSLIKQQVSNRHKKPDTGFLEIPDDMKDYAMSPGSMPN